MATLHDVLRALDKVSVPNNNTLEGCLALSDCGREDTDSSLWYVGVIVSIIGSILSNFGVNTQKYSMIQEIRRSSAERSYFSQPIWVLGLVMVILGAVADFGALGFAAQSLITPVGGFTMVANLFFASYWLGETITRLDLAATLLIILGIILVAAFADKSSQCFSLDSLMCLYKRPQFIGYAVVIFGSIVVVYVGIIFTRRRIIALKDETDSRAYKRLHMISPLLCASLSGLIGAQSVLFAKSTIEILKSTARGNPEFSNVATYIILICMLVAIFGQIHWLAVGLKDFDAVIMVPVFQCVFVVFSIIGGAAYFGEFRTFSRLQTIMFPLGVVILVIGVLGLAMHKSRSAEELLNEEDDIESALEVGTPVYNDEPSVVDGPPSSVSSTHTPKAGSAAPSSTQTGASHYVDRASRRESVNRYDEFTRLNPVGAVAHALWNEIDGLDLLHRLQSHGPRLPLFELRGDSRRRSSVPSRRSSVPSRRSSHRFSRPQLHEFDLGVSDSSLGSGERSPRPMSGRRSKARSFAGVEHLLSASKRTLVSFSRAGRRGAETDHESLLDESEVGDDVEKIKLRPVSDGVRRGKTKDEDDNSDDDDDDDDESTHLAHTKDPADDPDKTDDMEHSL